MEEKKCNLLEKADLACASAVTLSQRISSARRVMLARQPMYFLFANFPRTVRLRFERALHSWAQQGTTQGDKEFESCQNVTI